MSQNFTLVYPQVDIREKSFSLNLLAESVNLLIHRFSTDSVFGGPDQG